MSDKKIRVGILGAGSGASSLLKILSGEKNVDIVGLSYRSSARPAVGYARKMNISTYKDFRKLVESSDVDLLIEATGADTVKDYLDKEKKSTTAVLSGYGAWFLWKMVDEYEQRQEEMTRVLREQEVLYNSGVMLASAANTEQTLELILKSAMNLMNMEAGSLALYDEEKGIMQVKVSLGFNMALMPSDYSWEVRPGGLTGRILSSDRPTAINDLRKVSFDTEQLKNMGIRSIIAIPLRVERKIVGILYVDGFKPKKFMEREINVMNLLGAQAAAAIDKALLLEKAEIQAMTDELTKLYNHRYFVRSLEKEINRAQRYGQPLSLCMIDVDNFKNFNDTFGHLKGNDVLTKLATILKRTARDSDIVSRYGGEEFAIILTQSDFEKSVSGAERIRHEVEHSEFPGEETQPNGKITVSIGVATYPDDSKNPFELIECADRALYYSKENGRNAVTAYSLMEKSSAWGKVFFRHFGGEPSSGKKGECQLTLFSIYRADENISFRGRF